MAEFCLECLKKFEPNANEHNTVLSEELYFCEGCCDFKPVVVAFDDGSDSDKPTYKLLEIATELDARERSSNLIFDKFQTVGWKDLCQMGIDILTKLREGEF